MADGLKHKTKRTLGAGEFSPLGASLHEEGLKAGQLYGYKIKGDFDPNHGLRFNENKLLLDPYAEFREKGLKCRV